MWKPGALYRGTFTTQRLNGEAVNADALPTGEVVRLAAVDGGTAVIISNIVFKIPSPALSHSRLSR